MRRVAAALVHYPVHDRSRSVVTSAITNLDLHDISRSAHTYGLSDLFIVHPVAAQRLLAERVREHWISGSGARRIPDRTPAISLLRVVSTLNDALVALGEGSKLWVTSARGSGELLDFPAARAEISLPGPPVLIVFGTGWGLADAITERADARLSAILGRREDGYNHLSVRAAAAIIFDRLLSLQR
ncbi:MAG TPA: RNA methyltransferase [Polyangiaceae bacterium]|nr:RNA methyltransferase [Polyangiaceae bacterium]